MAEKLTIREQRKAETRKRLIRAAQQLFELQGYAGTTLESVAERAGMHVQTLYRHFPNKVELAAASGEEELARFRRAIRDKQRNGTTFAFWRNWVASSVGRAVGDDNGRSFRDALHYRDESPVIALQLHRGGREFEDLLAESFAKDLLFDDTQERLDTARLIAITLYGTNNHVIRRYAEEDDFDLGRETVAAIDRVEQLYKHLFR